MDQRVLQPPGWPRPRGYANGIVASGETIFLAGQIGWDAEGRFAAGMAGQVRQALANIVTLLTEAVALRVLAHDPQRAGDAERYLCNTSEVLYVAWQNARVKGVVGHM